MDMSFFSISSRIKNKVDWVRKNSYGIAKAYECAHIILWHEIRSARIKKKKVWELLIWIV